MAYKGHFALALKSLADHATERIEAAGEEHDFLKAVCVLGFKRIEQIANQRWRIGVPGEPKFITVVVP
jgi:hypothetical protein